MIFCFDSLTSHICIDSWLTEKSIILNWLFKLYPCDSLLQFFCFKIKLKEHFLETDDSFDDWHLYCRCFTILYSHFVYSIYEISCEHLLIFVLQLVEQLLQLIHYVSFERKLDVFVPLRLADLFRAYTFDFFHIYRLLHQYSIYVILGCFRWVSIVLSCIFLQTVDKIVAKLIEIIFLISNCIDKKVLLEVAAEGFEALISEFLPLLKFILRCMYCRSCAMSSRSLSRMVANFWLRLPSWMPQTIPIGCRGRWSGSSLNLELKL